MRMVQVLAFGVFTALLVACGAWALIWFAMPLPLPNTIQAAPDAKWTSTIIHLNSDPQGADATASLGWSCQTPCSIDLLVEEPFTVTFTRRGFSPSIVPVQIEPAQPGASDARFAPNPVFAALKPVHGPEAKTTVARAAVSRAAPPRDAHEATSNDGLISRGWKYLERKAQDWQLELGRLIRSGSSR